MSFEGKKYLVLGAGGAVGSELCRRLLAAGAFVSAFVRDPAQMKELSEKFPHRLRVEVWSFEEGSDALKARVDASAVWADRPLSGLVVAVGSILVKPAHLTRDADWQQTMDLNLTLPFWAARAALAHLTATPGASLVFFSSVAARLGLPNHEAIAAAKAGLEGFVRSLAATYAPRGVRANAVAPSLTRSKMSARFGDGVFRSSAETHPLKRTGEAADLASAALWLLSPEQSWVTGQVLGVDGGLSSLRGSP
jgi:NAD(P)-dependent dehydrogenase (short-subunit alcohol dehydrogenase family)